MPNKNIRRKIDTEVIEFQGVYYTRRPGKKYYKAWRYDRDTGKQWADALHRAVWRHHNGDIPAGRDVHHVDGNYDNNAPDNLALISRSDHAKLHNHFAKFNARPDADAVRRRAVAIGWAQAAYKQYTCLRCGADFQSRRVNLPPKFCSKRCCGNHNRQLRRARLRSGG